MIDLNDELQPTVTKLMQMIKMGSRNRLLQAGYAKSPAAQLTDIILHHAAQLQASDIHFEPWPNQLLVRFRLDGRLVRVCYLPPEVSAYLISCLKLMSGMDIAEKRLPQDGSILYGADRLDIRASSIPVLHGEKIVLRILGTAGSIMELEHMGFSAENLTLFKRLLKSAGGIIAITGPVNSGKSTLLYAALRRLNKADVNIVTVEDPIEMQLDGINQMQVNQKAGMSFGTGLKAVLRQDPDVVMVGEIRDEITAKEAVRAALTGHLVLTTLHTADAAGVPARLIDMGVKPSLLSITLLAALSQRLVRRICPHCMQSYVPPDNSLEAAVLGGAFHTGMQLQRGTGCIHCRGSGYSGRTALQEIMTVSDDIKLLIADNAADIKLKRLLRQSGMRTLLDDGKNKILDGTTTAQEVWRVLNGIS